ncbi:MAG: hypothetical protein ABI986_08275, partial [Chloroflexota bacterium]
GIPLAIELAAARTKLLSPEQIAARLDDRFRLLVGGDRNRLPRQQTLRALIDWSYDLLSDEEKKFLQICSVFVGGWTLETLEAVADDANAFEYLGELINKSLVVAEEHHHEMRYFMLETIRQYAKEKLIEANRDSVMSDRHFIHFSALSEKMWLAFFSTDLFTWRDTADDEADNFRAALEWGLQHHIETALDLAANFCLVSDSTANQAEGLAFLTSALERFRTLPPVEGESDTFRRRLLAKALLVQGFVATTSYAVTLGMQAMQEAIIILRQLDDNKRMLGYSLELHYMGSSLINTIGEAEAEAKEGYIILSEINDQWGLGLAYANMARVALVNGEHAEFQKFAALLKKWTQSAPQSYQVGFSYLNIGARLRWTDPEGAKEYYEEGLKIFRHLRHKNFETVLLNELGHVARMTGKTTEAKGIYKQTLSDFQDLGHRPAIANQLECFAFIAIAEEEPERAAKLFGAAEALREKVNAQMQDLEYVEYDNSVRRLRMLLNETEFNSLWELGRALTMDEAIQFALN